jgi:hypothetical protein
VLERKTTSRGASPGRWSASSRAQRITMCWAPLVEYMAENQDRLTSHLGCHALLQDENGPSQQAFLVYDPARLCELLDWFVLACITDQSCIFSILLWKQTRRTPASPNDYKLSAHNSEENFKAYMYTQKKGTENRPGPCTNVPDSDITYSPKTIRDQQARLSFQNPPVRVSDDFLALLERTRTVRACQRLTGTGRPRPMSHGYRRPGAAVPRGAPARAAG